jgi:hypothetical protein
VTIQRAYSDLRQKTIQRAILKCDCPQRNRCAATITAEANALGLDLIVICITEMSGRESKIWLDRDSAQELRRDLKHLSKEVN